MFTGFPVNKEIERIIKTIAEELERKFREEINDKLMKFKGRPVSLTVPTDLTTESLGKIIGDLLDAGWTAETSTDPREPATTIDSYWSRTNFIKVSCS